MISSALAILETDEQRNELSMFYNKYKNRFYAIAFEHLHNIQDSEDAIQEAFLRIANAPDKFFLLTDEKRISYVCAILRNVSIDMFKKNIKEATDEVPDDIVYKNDYALLENSLFNKISHKEILVFIDNLPQLQRNVLKLTCLSGLSIDETAQILKISKSAVNQRLYLARKSIKEFLIGRNKSDE